jgi:hypothetical protein
MILYDYDYAPHRSNRRGFILLMPTYAPPTTTTTATTAIAFLLARVLSWRYNYTTTTTTTTTTTAITRSTTTTCHLPACFTFVSLSTLPLLPSMPGYLAYRSSMNPQSPTRNTSHNRYAVPDPADRAACARFRLRRRKTSRGPAARACWNVIPPSLSFRIQFLSSLTSSIPYTRLFIRKFSFFAITFPPATP